MPPKFSINPNISKAETIPSDFYLNENIFEESKEKIFVPSWQFIADTHTLNRTNIYPFSFLKGFIDEPLVLIKNGKSINCYSNVCTHRAHLVANQPCQANKLRCPYHGRTYNLDGSFNFMSGFENVENIRKKPTKMFFLFSSSSSTTRFFFRVFWERGDGPPVLAHVAVVGPEGIEGQFGLRTLQ